ncbi:hypothetical protein UlMin_041542 [Ulmus minor]
MAAAPSSSISFFGNRDEIIQNNQILPPQPPSASAPAPPKKRRNQSSSNSDAEIIALSPKTLMATNRFICEVCNKGFQREQNLQLHRRGHNLPWKLKQKTNKEQKRKVFLCPEPTCVHHDPSRALGDLTGIKKHYSRKHGEKKWKCEKCSKRYAVQSDWKAHSKTCGTREYRCECGTLFSRRDSLITHRAFCDALAQETARHPTSLNTIGGHFYGNNHMGLGLSHMGTSQFSSLQSLNHSPTNNMLRLGGTKLEHHLLPNNPSSFVQPPPQNMPSSAFFMHDAPNQGFQEHQPFLNKPMHVLSQLPDLQANANSSAAPDAATATSLFNLFNTGNGGGGQGVNLFSNNIGDHIGSGMSSLFGNSIGQENINNLPQMSATALLQKAAQIDSTSSIDTSSLIRSLHSSSTRGGSTSDKELISSNNIGSDFGSDIVGDNLRAQMGSENHLQGLMSSFANGSSSNIFGGGQRNDFGHHAFNGHLDETKLHQNLGVSFGGSDKLTLDFLGVGEIVRNMQQQQQHGITTMSSLDLKPTSTQQSQLFGGSEDNLR